MLFLRRRPAQCFFCLSAPSPPPVDPRSFRCPHCQCWNRVDASGEIASDDPAMHDHSLNVASFAKRASPNKHALPSAYPSAPLFCHTCQTNQMLLVSLLSNYLPSPQHPDYAHRLEQLPAYRDSLHVRYPPVCADCLPAVQDEIEQKNQMARTKALAGWLKQSKGKERLVPAAPNGRHALAFHLVIWRVRGALWCTTLLCTLVVYATVIQGYTFPRSLARAIPALPLLCLSSLVYTTWDPTYYRFTTARIQGRDVRVKGKPHYVILQTLSWLSRFTASILLFLSWQSPSRDYLHIAAYPSSYRVGAYCTVSLVIELLVFSLSFTILHLQRPPTIRLIETSTRSFVRDTPELSARSTRPSPAPKVPINNEPDLLASLTLSSKPLISSNPMFGHPSLASPVPVPAASRESPIEIDDTPDEDAMDWTPTNPSPIRLRKTIDSDGGWLRPQLFFPPERPTGLESLFANTKLDDRHANSTKPTAHSGLWNVKVIRWWTATCLAVLVPLGTVVYHRWTKG